MKAVNKISQILAIVFSAAAVIFFFLPFANVTAVNGEQQFIGAQLCFGTEIEGYGKLAQSSQILFCFILSVVSVLFAGLTFKFKKIRYWAPAVALTAAIYMLVITLSRPGMFVDIRPLLITGPTTYTIFVLLTTLALFAGAIFGACHLFVDDLIMVREGKAKKTILRRVLITLRDYKSELKKIVWPGLNDVVKNTLIVIIMCAIIGAFIWLVDRGLITLLEVFTKK